MAVWIKPSALLVLGMHDWTVAMMNFFTIYFYEQRSIRKLGAPRKNRFTDTSIISGSMYRCFLTFLHAN